MATTNNLKFFHVAKLPSSGVTGGIYFDKTAGEIAVWNGTDWEKYSGIVKSVVWSGSPANDSGSLVITNFDGKSTTIDFSDVASKQDVIDKIATALLTAKTHADAIKVNGKGQDNNQNITVGGGNIALTGYNKPATTSAIAAEDTVNVAIGKLERGLEAAVAGGVTAVIEGNGISVDATDVNKPKVSVKIDTASEKFGENAVLTAGADGLKISGIADKISAEINKLSVGDAAVANQYVSSVSETNGKITVSRENLPVIGVADGDKILSLSSSKIGATLSLKYDSNTRKIYLYGKDSTDASKAISFIDCSDFIKDGMLDNATYDHTTHKLTLTFNTASGKENIDVDLSKLVDTYAAGDGLDLVTTGVTHPTFKINLDGSSYLTVAGGKLHFDDTAIHSKISGDINTKIGTLNATKSNEETATECGSTASSQIKVEVAEDKGKLTGVTVTAPVFAKPADITEAETKLIGSNEKDTKDSNTIWGAKKYADTQEKAAESYAKSYTDSAIQGLDATVDQNVSLEDVSTTGIKAQVVENDGKITGVTVAIANGTYAKPADITTAINALDATVSSAATADTASTQIKVTVTENDGKITAVDVNAPAFDLSGAAADAETNANTYTDSAIQKLDAEVKQEASATQGLALHVVEADGKLTSVSGSMNWCEW